MNHGERDDHEMTRTLVEMLAEAVGEHHTTLKSSKNDGNLRNTSDILLSMPRKELRLPSVLYVEFNTGGYGGRSVVQHGVGVQVYNPRSGLLYANDEKESTLLSHDARLGHAHVAIRFPDENKLLVQWGERVPVSERFHFSRAEEDGICERAQRALGLTLRPLRAHEWYTEVHILGEKSKNPHVEARLLLAGARELSDKWGDSDGTLLSLYGPWGTMPTLELVADTASRVGYKVGWRGQSGVSQSMRAASSADSPTVGNVSRVTPVYGGCGDGL